MSGPVSTVARMLDSQFFSHHIVPIHIKFLPVQNKFHIAIAACPNTRSVGGGF